MGKLSVVVGKPFSFTSDSDRLYSYFSDLKKPGYINPSIFESHWSGLQGNYFTKKQLIEILKWSAGAIEQNCNSEDKIDLHGVISKNWQAWESGAIDYISDFNKKECSAIIEACRRLKLIPSPEFVSAFNDQLRQVRDGLTANDYSVIFQSAAHLGFQLPPSLNDHFLRQTIRVPKFLGRTHRTPIVWAAAINDCLNPNSGYDATAKTLRKMSPRQMRNDTALAQRYYSALWFDWNAAQPNRSDEGKVSNDEIKFANWLKGNQIGVYEHTSPIAELPQAIDMSVLTEGRLILTELDGPTHYVNLDLDSPFQLGADLDGLTQFRSALMAKKAPEERFVRLSTRTSSILCRRLCDLELKGAERLALTQELFIQVARSNDQYNLASIEDVGGGVLGVKIKSMFPQIG